MGRLQTGLGRSLHIVNTCRRIVGLSGGVKERDLKIDIFMHVRYIGPTDFWGRFQVRSQAKKEGLGLNRSDIEKEKIRTLPMSFKAPDHGL